MLSRFSSFSITGHRLLRCCVEEVVHDSEDETEGSGGEDEECRLGNHLRLSVITFFMLRVSIDSMSTMTMSSPKPSVLEAKPQAPGCSSCVRAACCEALALCLAACLQKYQLSLGFRVCV